MNVSVVKRLRHIQDAFLCCSHCQSTHTTSHLKSEMLSDDTETMELAPSATESVGRFMEPVYSAAS